jgi:hypothetical protein
MTRGAVKEQIDLLINEIIEKGLDEFKPWAVLGLGFMPGNALLKVLFGSQVRDELGSYRAMYNNQFRIVLDYAEDVVEEGEGASFEGYGDEILEWDVYYVNYEGDEDERFADDLVSRYEKIGKDLAPIVESDEDGFWEAARDAYDKDELVGKLEHAFSYTDVLGRYEDDIDVRTPPVLLFLRLRYTDEVVRTLKKSEREVLEEMKRKADEVYDG